MTERRFERQADARRYLFAVLAAAVENDLADRDGRIRGGLAYRDELMVLREARRIVAQYKDRAER
jgi:hypothetical protein